MRRFPVFLMVSHALWAALKTRNVLPQYCNISGMNGRASRQAWSSRVARIASALRTSIQSPARRPGERRVGETESSMRMAIPTDGFGRIQRGLPKDFLHYSGDAVAPERLALLKKELGCLAP